MAIILCLLSLIVHDTLFCISYTFSDRLWEMKQQIKEFQNCQDGKLEWYYTNLLIPLFSSLCLRFFHHQFYSCLKLKTPFIVKLYFITQTIFFFFWILRDTFHSLIQQLLMELSLKSHFSQDSTFLLYSWEKRYSLDGVLCRYSETH